MTAPTTTDPIGLLRAVVRHTRALFLAVDRSGTITLVDGGPPSAEIEPARVVGRHVTDLLAGQPVAVQHIEEGLRGVTSRLQALARTPPTS